MNKIVEHGPVVLFKCDLVSGYFSKRSRDIAMPAAATWDDRFNFIFLIGPASFTRSGSFHTEMAAHN